MKVCTKCGVEKALEEFAIDNSKCNGRRSKCKECLAEYRAANKDMIASKNSEYRAINKERIAKRRAEYRANNRELLAKKQKEYRSANMEKCAESVRRCYANNGERYANKRAEYQSRNRELLAKKSLNYYYNNLERVTKYHSDRRARLADSYVCAKLGLPLATAPPALIELQREQIKLKRLIKELTDDEQRQATP